MTIKSKTKAAPCIEVGSRWIYRKTGREYKVAVVGCGMVRFAALDSVFASAMKESDFLQKFEEANHGQ